MTSLQDAACTASRHGTINAYKNHGCRCPLAVRAWSRYMKGYRLRRHRGQSAHTDATGTRRRLRALMAIGWTCKDIGARMGCSNQAVSQLTRRTNVLTATAQRVRGVYDDLANTPGPSAYTVTAARHEGWLAPLWYDDERIDDPAYDPLLIDGFPNLSKMENGPTSGPKTVSSTGVHTMPETCGQDNGVDSVVVERLLDGQPPLHVTRAERAEAVRLLHGRGKTRSEIGVQLHMSGGRVAQILDRFVGPLKHTPDTNNDRQEASA